MGFSLDNYIREKQRGGAAGGGFSLDDYAIERGIRQGTRQQWDQEYDDLGSDVAAFSKRMGEEYAGRQNTWQSAESMTEYRNRTGGEIDQLLQRADASRSYYTKYGGIYDEVYGKGTAQKLLGGLDEQTKYLQSVKTGLEQEAAWRGQFARQEDFDRYKRVEGYAEIPKAGDFSKYSFFDEETVNKDKDYAFVNQVPQEKHLLGISALPVQVSSERWDKSPSSMTKEELGIYNYLYATKGKEAASQYFEDIHDELLERQRSHEETALRERGEQHPVKASLESLMMTPFKWTSAAGQLADFVKDGKIDENAAYNRFSYAQSALRSGATENIQDKLGKFWGPVGSFGYQTGMSMGDFLLNTAVAGGNEPLALAIMGTGAAADATLAAKDRGLSDKQSFWLGTIAGAAEVVTEKFSLETLLEPDWEKGVANYVLKNMAAEGSEEMASDLINGVADWFIAGDEAEVKRTFRSYRDQGFTSTQALLKTTLGRLGEYALDGLGGALSGGVMAGAASGVHVAENYQAGKSLQGASPEQLQALIDEGLRADPSMQANQLAKELQSKLQRGEQLSTYEVGSLFTADLRAIEAARRAQEQAQKKNGKRHGAVDAAAPAPAQEAAGAFSTGNAAVDEALGVDVKNAASGETADVSSPDTGAGRQRALQVLESARGADGTLTRESVERAFMEESRQPGTDVEQLVALYESLADGSMGYLADESGVIRSAADTQRKEQINGKRTGDYISDGDAGRGAAERAGAGGGGVDGGTAGKTALDHIRAIGERARAADALGARPVSSRELGLQNGTDRANVRVLPENGWDEELRTVAQKLTYETGKPVQFVLGGLEIALRGGTREQVRGVNSQGQILVQADHPRFTATQIGDHEHFHSLARENPGLVAQIRERIAASRSEAELGRLIDRYLERMRGILDLTRELSGPELEEAVQRVLEEIFADAYAGMNAFGADASRYQGEVSAALEERLGKAPDGRAYEATGPPVSDSDTSSSRDGTPRDEYIDSLNDQLRSGELTDEEYDELFDQYYQGGNESWYSLEEGLQDELQRWYDETSETDRLVSPGHFRIGTTSDTLKSIGVRDGNIYWRKSKIGEILFSHPEMSIDTIKAVPELLEHPLTVLKSRTRSDSIVALGNLLADNGNKVMAALVLTPKAGGNMEAEFSLITSAHGRTDDNIRNLLKNSEILYLDKERADTWLMQLRVQFPSRQPVYGSMGSITYKDGDVNIQGKTLEELGGRIDKAEGTSDVKQKYSLNEADAQQDPEWLQEALAEGDRRRADSAAFIDRLTGGTRRETLPAKAREYLERAERGLLTRVSSALSVPSAEGRRYLTDTVREISDTYLREGTVPQKTLDKLFETAYEQGVVVDRSFLEENKHVKDYLKRTAVTISETDRADIPDFNSFRKSAAFTLRIRNEGGVPVDTAYAELRTMSPQLFPEEVTHPADQLQLMYEVGRSIHAAEKSLDAYYGEQARDFREWAKRDFETAVNETMTELRSVRRYADERQAKASALPVYNSIEEVTEGYKQLKSARRTYEKAQTRNLLTDHDEVQLGRLLRGELELEHLDPSRDNMKGIRAVFEAKQEYERIMKGIREWNNKRRAELRDQADGFLKTANDWKDKAAGILYSRETMERNIQDIVPDAALAKEINRTYFQPVHEAAARSTRLKNDFRDRVRALDLSTKETKAMLKAGQVSEAHAVQLLGEAEDNIRVLEQSRGRMKLRDGRTISEWREIVSKLWEQNPQLDRAKVEHAVEEFRKIYDDLFQRMNESRIRNGYEPVNYRQGYFPHFQPQTTEGVMGLFGKALGITTEVTALPTTINGLTHTFKPGIQWFGNAQERLGFNTAYDAVQGFDKYIEGVADVIYQTDNIQRLRALAAQTRYRTGDEGIRKQIDAVREDATLAEQDKQNRINEIFERGRYTLSNFVVELEEYTNLLANKKSRADREMEQKLGRNMYNVVKGLESRVAANMVAVNPGSWLTNFVPLTQGGAMLSTKELLRGMGQTLKAYKESDGMVERSSFLTNRAGSDPLVRTWAQKTSATLSSPMEYIDQFTAGALIRARYNQNIKQGLSETAAMEEADAWCAGVMADRSKGSTPTLFSQKNPLTKVFTQFQLEVNNTFSYLFKDMPRGLREKGVAALAGALVKFFLGAWFYNEVYEFFVGRRCALDPIGILNDTVGDFTGYEMPNLVSLISGAVTGELPSFKTEKKSKYDAVTGLGKNVAEELPFIGGVLGGGRVPVSSAIPSPSNLVKAASNDNWSPEKRLATAGKELAKPLTYMLPPFGGGQVKKAAEGLSAVKKGGSYSLDAEGNPLLQYPVFNDNAKDAVKSTLSSVIFGKSSLPTAQEWVDRGFGAYSAKETAAYQAVTEAGGDQRTAYAMLQAVDKAKTETQKWLAVTGSGLPAEQQLLALKALCGDTDAGVKKYRKFELAYSFGVEPEAYVAVKAQMPEFDTDKNKSYSNAEIQAAIDSLEEPSVWLVYGGGDQTLTTEQKAALWQLLTGSTSAKNNPYSKETGAKVIDAVKPEEEASGR